MGRAARRATGVRRRGRPWRRHMWTSRVAAARSITRRPTSGESSAMIGSIGTASFVNTRQAVDRRVGRSTHFVHGSSRRPGDATRGALSIGATGGLRVGRSAGMGLCRRGALGSSACGTRRGSRTNARGRHARRSAHAVRESRDSPCRATSDVASSRPSGRVRGPTVVASREYIEVRAPGAIERRRDGRFYGLDAGDADARRRRLAARARAVAGARIALRCASMAANGRRRRTCRGSPTTSAGPSDC